MSSDHPGGRLEPTVMTASVLIGTGPVVTTPPIDVPTVGMGLEENGTPAIVKARLMSRLASLFRSGMVKPNTTIFDQIRGIDMTLHLLSGERSSAALKTLSIWMAKKTDSGSFWFYSIVTEPDR